MTTARYFILALCVLDVAFAQSSVDVRVIVRDVAIQTNSQWAGNIELVTSRDPFEDATAETPIYLRVVFDKQAVLCNTLVWTSLENPDVRTRSPIFLPIQFNRNDPGVTIDTSSGDAVSVVRWKAGESSIWLKVVKSVSNVVNGQLLDESNQVRFSIGFSGERYWDNNSSRFDFNEANLPTSVRDPSKPEMIMAEESVSTLLCLDYTESSLRSSPTNPETDTIHNFNIVSYDENTHGVDGPTATAFERFIQLGNQRLPNFSADNPIAKGHRMDCEGNFTEENTVVGFATRCGEGLISFSSVREMAVNCAVGSQFDRDWGFHKGSMGVISLEDPQSDYGFLVQTDGMGNAITDEDGYPLLFTEDFTFGAHDNLPFAVFASNEDLFVATGGHLLSRRAIVVYDGFNSNNQITVRLGSTVYQDAAADNASVAAGFKIYSSNEDQTELVGEAPFDDPLEHPRRCPLVFREIDYGQGVDLGQFTDCE